LVFDEGERGLSIFRDLKFREIVFSLCVFFVLLWRGFIYSKGAREPQSTTPVGRGGGLAAAFRTGIAFVVVHAVEAVGATHGVLAEYYFFFLEPGLRIGPIGGPVSRFGPARQPGAGPAGPLPFKLGYSMGVAATEPMMYEP
jgi:hypothetical protein